ncbi:NAD(P)H-binding protein [Sediminibacterium soli]|uniref:NAD(P)H-binding protein n=1 Tax=Sediminibacterium soli TaxID=2698829 RepID=UPI00137AF582|nr:NAD(P)H-binding protein [Sediminibacterium soli]NCI46539.1 NAD(P)H-binding protein [Sediminibacterium soli]
MKIIVSGSLGNIGSVLTGILVAADHTVTVISSTPARQKDIEAAGAKAAIGSVTDAAFLAETCRGADALFAMTPPNLGGADVIANTTRAGQAYAAAVRASGIPRVVMLSSVGADLAAGNGPIAGLHNIEQLYHALEGVSVTYLRAGFFFTNFFNDIPLIRQAGIIGGNYPASLQMALVHPADIAAAAAEELQVTGAGHTVRYVVSDIRRPGEIAGALGAAVGIPALAWVEFSDRQSLQGMVQAGLPEEIAGLYTEMGAGFRNGSIQHDFEKQGSPVTGNVKLVEFAKAFGKKWEKG